jgi:hypothetical protein
MATAWSAVFKTKPFTVTQLNGKSAGRAAANDYNVKVTSHEWAVRHVRDAVGDET